MGLVDRDERRTPQPLRGLQEPLQEAPDKLAAFPEAQRVQVEHGRRPGLDERSRERPRRLGPRGIVASLPDHDVRVPLAERDDRGATAPANSPSASITRWGTRPAVRSNTSRSRLLFPPPLDAWTSARVSSSTPRSIATGGPPSTRFRVRSWVMGVRDEQSKK